MSLPQGGPEVVLSKYDRAILMSSTVPQEAEAGGEVRDALRVDSPDGIGQSRADRAGDRP
ncbi:hypothetical protein [Candidatus Palauibacter sp.]|uniref:hypothetical protein n=1 Tax=Candidatus Palauibacter sp. TaxID=3101350 RepID=UPI003CC5FFD9